MPISRKKSCHQCRIAKARCSLDSICSRCLERRLACEYTTASSRWQPYNRASLLHAPSAPNDLTPESLLDLFDLANSETPIQTTYDVATNQITAQQSKDTDIEFTSLVQSQDEVYYPVQNGRPSAGTSVVENNAPSEEVPFFETTDIDAASAIFPWSVLADSAFMGSIQSKIGVERVHRADSTPKTSDDLFQTYLTSSAEHEGEDPSREAAVTVYGRRYERFLRLRHAPTSEQSLTARVLLGQIENYPKMLSQGSRLPPFIHPQCIINDQLPQECTTRNGTHTCLHEPLANAQSLSHLFLNRTPGSAKMVWKMIYDEQTRLKKEYRDFDDGNLLAAVQAMLIYLLIQAQDPDSIAENDVASLVVATSDMSTKLHFGARSHKYKSDIYQLPQLEQRSWAFYEGIRRTINLFYVIGTVLVVLVGNPDVPGCDSIQSTPLNCVRELWNTDTSESWASRLHTFVKQRASRKILTLHDLLQIRGDHAKKEDNTDALVQKDLTNWCENLDDFGTLVWMASALNRAAS
ncbi:hypothetical protein GGR57DRAFT_433609 [Xylariaceae sp. FL1272]|nr:hypothetical protein GGR57DRAFT_433609 [Xylariaceae sp. FL1272]